MSHPLQSRKRTTSTLVVAAAVCLLLLVAIGCLLWYMWPAPEAGPYRYVSTVAGTGTEFGEPFGVSVLGKAAYVSDGQSGKIWKVDASGTTIFAEGLDTPSGLVFDKSGNLIVADTGSHTIRSIDTKGNVSTVAGLEGRSGSADGDTSTALFNGPVGIAIGTDGRVFVADTYNDRIRVISDGKVSTLAGSTRGYTDGIGEGAKFDTPAGLAVWRDKVLVADTGNRRVRVIEPDGRVWTLAGTGDDDLKDGSLGSAAFVEPTALAVDKEGVIYVADGNAIRSIAGGVIPLVAIVANPRRGLTDGAVRAAKFNAPTGLAIGTDGDLLVADSENRLVRHFSRRAEGTTITREQIAALADKAEGFRIAQPARWPFDPADAKRDIAGTLGELRGTMNGVGDVHFHNGLDIAGAYGEVARFIRDEKVLGLAAAENFGSLRELIRMPTMGYIHIRLGRDQSGRPFDDDRFRFERDPLGKLIDVRVPRGAKFKAGEPIGTLNAMNHVHLIAGRSGSEMNALDALILPGIADTRPPVIEKVTLLTPDGKEIETGAAGPRIKLAGKVRIVIRAFDQMDGNSERRRLGIYKAGYQILRTDKAPVADPNWGITFDRMPSSDAIRFTYALGSHSGATGETIFNYIATNFVDGDIFRDDYFDTAGLEVGRYYLRALAADYFGNTASKDIEIEVTR